MKVSVGKTSFDKTAQELYDEGLIIVKLDDKGQPIFRPSRTGELEPVLVHYAYATLEEIAFWHKDHPGVSMTS